MIGRAEDYPWSSANAHLAGQDDALVKVAPLLALVKGWRSFIAVDGGDDSIAEIRRHELTGRPLGAESFMAKNIWGQSKI